ncbi:MAG TPA: hypothetical protein GX714_17350 [Chloroflexi bacterium]|jgi:anti-sigma factor RsiW|nr:hypothetical protein [Chloroflexota bacterium]
MRCPSQGALRAYIDGELDEAQREAIERHLARCERREDAARLAATGEMVRSHLDVVAPTAEPDSEQAVLLASASAAGGTGPE